MRGKVRRDTPGYSHRLYFGIAGASLMPRSGIDMVIEHLQRGSCIGEYEAAGVMGAEIARFCGLVAALSRQA
jgi:hypothetical protein